MCAYVKAFTPPAGDRRVSLLYCKPTDFMLNNIASALKVKRSFSPTLQTDVLQNENISLILSIQDESFHHCIPIYFLTNTDVPVLEVIGHSLPHADGLTS